MEADRMRILVIALGGTHVKVLATGDKTLLEIPSGLKNDTSEDGRCGASRHSRSEI